jgi:hypothetical protein
MRSSRNGSSSSGRGAPIASGSKYRRGAFMRAVLSWDCLGNGIGRFRFRRNSPNKRSVSRPQGRFVDRMSGDFAAAQSPGPTARKRYFPNSKAATGFMARKKLRPSATALANPRGDPFGAASSYSNPKNTRNPGRFAGPNGDRETGQPFAAALMQRARRLSLMRPKGRKSRGAADRNFSIPANRPRPVSSTSTRRLFDVPSFHPRRTVLTQTRGLRQNVGSSPC